MQRLATGPVIAAFAIFALWIAFNTTRVVLAIRRDDSDASWTSLAVLYGIAAISAWFAFRLYRIRRAKRQPPLTNG
jgi:hypothetical protein